MWMNFLSFLLTNVLLTASENTTTNQLWTLTESSNVTATKSTKGVISLLSNRGDHRRDVLVVLPVMQGNSDLTNSNLQMLYTKIPITTIINEQPINQTTENSKRPTTDITSSVTNPVTPITTQATTTPNVTEGYLQQSTTSVTPLIKGDDYHHPYIDFLFTETAPKTQKSPLDYGYPESFKFAEELNNVAKNDKQEWTQSKLSEAESKKSTTTEDFTERDPFQMFESVKPLEINKMMSNPVVPSVTDSIIKQMAVKMKQESTETPYLGMKQSPSKRPTKKPQKVKLNQQKLNDVIFTPFMPFLMTSTDKVITKFGVQSTANNTQSSTSSFSATAIGNPSSTYKPILHPSTVKLDGESQDISRNSTFLAEFSGTFLSTPYSSSSDRTISPIQSQTTSTKPSSEVSPLKTTTAKTSGMEMITNSAIITSFSPNPNSVNKSPATPIMETSTSSKVVHEVKPSDFFLDKHLNQKHSFDSPASSVPQSTTAKPNFPADMLTNDMKNLLITLGLLNSEQDSSPLLLVSSTTATPNSTESQYIDSLFVKREPVAPTVDPDSYVNFKKLPVNPDKPQVSNDMRDLLSSFGLLPTTMSTHLEVDSILTRISRQQKLENFNTSTSILDDKMRRTLENFGLMKPTGSQMNRKGHVFQPSVYLEKLGDLQQAEKINNALEMIRILSMSKDVENLPIEELEQKLRNVTALLREDNFLDSNATDTPELTTELLSTMKNLISNNNSTTVAKEESGKASTTTVKQTQTTDSPITSLATSSSTISSSKRNASTSTPRYSRQQDKSRITTTPSVSTSPTTSSTIASTLPFEVASSTVATATSAKTFATTFAPTTKTNLAVTSTSRKPTTASTKIKLGIESSTSSGLTTVVTPASVNITQEEHIQVNYTPDASSVSLVKLSHNKSNVNVVMSPPPNSLSVQELQNLLKSNSNGVKRQQTLKSTATSSTTPSIVPGVSINNISNIEDTSSVSNTIKSSSNGNDSNSFNDSTTSIESSSAISSTTSSSNIDSIDISGITEETAIKADDSSEDNPPLEALADSFGGENEQQQQGDSWQANAKPNGLYFLLDWNTFLLVGEEDKRSIRIRFSPRAGNPRNFIPVKVP